MIKRYIQTLFQKILPYIGIEINRSLVSQSLLRLEYSEMKREIKNKTPENPCLHGFKCYSQFDEDGIIDYICTKLNISQGVFVEFGCGNGLENNTHLLLLKGWKGLWVDGDEKNFKYIRRFLPATSSLLIINNSFVTLDNVSSIVGNALGLLNESDFDLLSMDLDGNDIYLIENIVETYSNNSPKVIVAEYNGKIPFGIELAMPYESNASRRDGDDFWGVSLSMLVAKLSGYTLLCCGLTGCNAYFVRNDLASKFTIYEPKDLFIPPAHHLRFMSTGSKPSLKFLEVKISKSAQSQEAGYIK